MYHQHKCQIEKCLLNFNTYDLKLFVENKRNYDIFFFISNHSIHFASETGNWQGLAMEDVQNGITQKRTMASKN